MSIVLSAIRNPILDRLPGQAVRDPAAVYAEGLFRCYHTTATQVAGRYAVRLDVSTSADLVDWSAPQRVDDGSNMYGSPGNLWRHQDRWWMCCCSYPIPPGKLWGDESARLFLLESVDLVHWSAPRVLAAEGCQASWSSSQRQIDPYIVRHEGRWWCFYKASGNLGLLVSDDLTVWREASPERPVLGAADSTDGSTMENPCVLDLGGEYLMFFSPCREGRGIGVARSHDLLHWRDVRDLAFPALPWAPGGPTAPFVLWHEALGRWLMFFHGENRAGNAHGALLGLAWSDDLEHWTVP